MPGISKKTYYLKISANDSKIGIEYFSFAFKQNGLIVDTIGQGIKKTTGTNFGPF